MSEMSHAEEFELEGKSFVYIDFSGASKSEQFAQRIEIAEPVIAKYPKNSIYTITNVKGIVIDTKSSERVALFLMHNKPYVKYGAIIGYDGITKVIVSSILKMGQRDKFHFAFTIEQAIEWLLRQE